MARKKSIFKTDFNFSVDFNNVSFTMCERARLYGLRDINKELRPYGFVLKYIGYDKINKVLLYQYVTTKKRLKRMSVDVVWCWTLHDLTPEEWVADMLLRCRETAESLYNSVIKRRIKYLEVKERKIGYNVCPKKRGRPKKFSWRYYKHKKKKEALEEKRAKRKAKENGTLDE